MQISEQNDSCDEAKNNLTYIYSLNGQIVARIGGMTCIYFLDGWKKEFERLLYK